jgi:hypothetical protein
VGQGHYFIGTQIINSNIDERKHFCTFKLIFTDALFKNFVADFQGVPAWRKKKRRKVPPSVLSGPGTRDIRQLTKSSFPSTETPR